MPPPEITIHGFSEALQAAPEYLKPLILKAFIKFVNPKTSPRTELRMLRPELTTIFNPLLGELDGLTIYGLLDKQIGVRLLNLRLFGSRVLIIDSFFAESIMRIMKPDLFD